MRLGNAHLYTYLYVIKVNKECNVPNAKILVIDDEVSILNLISAYLRPEGYQVYTASDDPSGL